MTKSDFDRECKLCERPFTVYRWKPTGCDRHKNTEICQICSQMKNVCQCCLLDLEFKLPVQQRDALMGIKEKNELANTTTVTREWEADRNEKAIMNGTGKFQSTYGKIQMRNQFLDMAREIPYSKDVKRVCQFYAKGTCKRGEDCPYKHEVQKEQDKSKKTNQSFTLITQGISRQTSQYNEEKLVPPANLEIKTLYISNIPTEIVLEQDLREVFEKFGEIKDLRVMVKSRCAFINFVERSSAESAAENLHNNLEIKECYLRVGWGTETKKSREERNKQNSSEKKSNNDNNHEEKDDTPNYFGIEMPKIQVSNPFAVKPSYSSMDAQKVGTKRDR